MVWATGGPLENPGKRAIARPDQELGVVREQGPGAACEAPPLGEVGHEVRAAPIVAKGARVFDLAQHHLVQVVGGFDAGLAGDGDGETRASRRKLQRPILWIGKSATPSGS